jgi:cytochrome c peroxidase
VAKVKSALTGARCQFAAPARWLALAALVAWCADVAAQKREASKLLAPLSKEAPAPKDNPTTAEKAALGRQLFFDRRLSGDNSMSCATCHVPEKNWADGAIVGNGHGGKPLARNTPTLLNVAFLANHLWDGRAATLEQQSLVPIQAVDEMNQNLDELEAELNAVPGYVGQFERVFKSKVTRDGIAKSLAAFERTLITEPSPVDRYLAGDKVALSDAAQRGMELFFGDAGCARCHRGPTLSDGKFYRLGVSLRDEGRTGVTRKAEDRAKFRTPPLRNVAETAPYMHDGSLKSLEDVVTFYYRGVPVATDASLPLDVEPLTGRSFSEISDVVAFLESLSGKPPKIDAAKLP